MDMKVANKLTLVDELPYYCAQGSEIELFEHAFHNQLRS